MDAPRIDYALNGALLIWADGARVQCWQMKKRQLLHQFAGTLIGVAAHGQSLLLETSEGRIEARDLRGGAAIPLGEIPAGDYSPGSRYLIRRERQTITVVDALRGEMVRTLALTDLMADATTGHPSLSGATLSHDGEFLAVAVTGDSIWGEWARGYCIHLRGAAHFEFRVSSTAHSPIRRADSTYLLVESDANKRDLWDMRAGTRLQTVLTSDGLYGGCFLTTCEVEMPPLIALHTGRNWLVVRQSGRALATLRAECDMLDARFLPDPRYIAVLLGDCTVAFYDWRAGVRRAVFRLSGQAG